MSTTYQPLHHKYRPNRFDDLVGQESIVSTLKQALLSNKIAPAYLFCGPRGTGKTSSARILAKSLNCLEKDKPSIQPCGKCSLCKSIASGTALDIIEIDAASHTGVDNIRELIEKAQFAPVQARWKVYVIDECHMLSSAAFNALLKTLEEPPSKTVFVLATTDPQRLLQTILSRCQKFEFRRIPLQSLSNHLKIIASNEKIEIDDESINLIAQRSEGGLRDAESLLDQLSLLEQPITIQSIWNLLGEVPEKELVSLISSLSFNEPISLIKTLRNLFDQGKDAITILQGIATTIRDLTILKTIPDDTILCSFSTNSLTSLKELSLEISLEKILNWQSYLKGSESQIRLSLQPRLWLEVLLMGMLSKNQPAYSTNLNSERANMQKKAPKINSLEEKNRKLYSEQSTKKEEIQIQDPQNELANTWEKILAEIELPSTKMLLSQQAKLKSLSSTQASIAITPNWIGMIQSRKNLIEKAITKCLGRKLDLIFEKEIMNEAIKIPTKENIAEKREDIDLNKVKKDNELIFEDTEKFANFFNGEVIDLKDNNEF